MSYDHLKLQHCDSSISVSNGEQLTATSAVYGTAVTNLFAGSNETVISPLSNCGEHSDLD